MFGLFKKKKEKVDTTNLKHPIVDIHSHLLPSLDDGSESIEQSVEMIKNFASKGYKKLITTPHIMSDFYRNTPEGIREQLTLVREALKKEGVDIELEAAAEYYLDEGFIKKIEDPDTEILTFGDNYVLFETSYINQPPQLDDIIFALKSNGYKPVFAHPERYTYMYHQPEYYKTLFDKGLYFQINLLSLTGYYSEAAKKICEMLIDENMVHFIGTDCHKPKHIERLDKVRAQKYYTKALNRDLLNDSLL